jgi:TRAP-type mannitol/chloroaromatic compound transport system permease small subunit
MPNPSHWKNPVVQRSALRLTSHKFFFLETAPHRGFSMTDTTAPRGIVAAYVRGIDRLSGAVGTLAMYLIFLMVGVLLLDAVTRNVIEFPLHWCIEFAQFTLAAYYFLGGAMTLRDDDHARMDLLYERLSTKCRARIDLITSICMLVFLGVLLFGSVSSTIYSWETNERRFSMWNPPMAPIKTLMVVCIGLMIAQALALIARNVATLRGRPLP